MTVEMAIGGVKIRRKWPAEAKSAARKRVRRLRLA
jgi:hypothetical protein